jgi:hypothetical protein
MREVRFVSAAMVQPMAPPWMVDADGSTTSGLVSQAETPPVILRLGDTLDAQEIAGRASAAKDDAEERAQEAGVKVALVRALDAAYAVEVKARQLREHVEKEFGSKRPFSVLIVEAVTHEEAILGLYGAYGIRPIAEPAAPPFPGVFADALDRAAQIEVEASGVYDTQLDESAVLERSLTVLTFEHIRWATRYRHWPAFSSAAAAAAPPPGGN